MSNEEIETIVESCINGQSKQMADQIDECQDMYDIFDYIKGYLDQLYTPEQAYKLFSDIVVRYHRIKFR